MKMAISQKNFKIVSENFRRLLKMFVCINFTFLKKFC